VKKPTRWKISTPAAIAPHSRHGRRVCRWWRSRRAYDAEKAARVAEKMRKGQFDLSDMREQFAADANMAASAG